MNLGTFLVHDEPWRLNSTKLFSFKNILNVNWESKLSK